MEMMLTRTICCQLDVRDQDAILVTTAEAFNAAASWIAKVCWKEGLTNPTTVHRRVYGQIRAQFGLGAQLAVCARMKVVEAIKSVRAKHHETCPQFGRHGSVRYDARTYTLIGQDRVSLNTMEGRIICQLVLGERQQTMLNDTNWKAGSADLVWRRGIYYLHVTQHRRISAALISVEPNLPTESKESALGVDLGIVNLATDSHEEHLTGAHVRVARSRYKAHRQRLQQRGTRSAKKRLRGVAGREARFQKDTNHCISKALVKKAAVACKARALEDLSGIREKKTVRRTHRYERHSRAFCQLRAFITYKATWAGIPVLLVDPRNTSRTCSVCGHCKQANRKSQAEFHCQRCGYEAGADYNAAINIARAAVNRPIVSPHPE